jgi:hypothetical protein
VSLQSFVRSADLVQAAAASARVKTDGTARIGLFYPRPCTHATHGPMDLPTHRPTDL